MGRRASICLGAAVALTAGAAPAAEPAPVRARLVASAAAPAPGSSVHLGVLLEIEPGWHVYWKNPGDAGLASEVRLELPEGFDSGPLEWPLPVRFVQPGDLVGYGYERELLVAAEVLLPDRSSGAGTRIGAAASWLACKERCVLGSAELEQGWPLATAEAEFARWNDGLPASRSTEGRPFKVSVVGGLIPGAQAGSVSLWLRWSEPPAGVEWFPESAEGLKISAPTVRTRGDLTRIDAELSLVGPGHEAIGDVNSLVVATDPAGVRRGWELVTSVRANP